MMADPNPINPLDDIKPPMRPEDFGTMDDSGGSGQPFPPKPPKPPQPDE